MVHMVNVSYEKEMIEQTYVCFGEDRYPAEDVLEVLDIVEGGFVPSTPVPGLDDEIGSKLAQMGILSVVDFGKSLGYHVANEDLFEQLRYDIQDEIA